MASPVAHSFVGLWTFLFLAKELGVRVTQQWRRRMGELCLLVFVANLADFDFVPELYFHRDFHRGFSHSLLATVIAALVFPLFWRIAGSFRASARIYFIAYASHLVIDFFTGHQLGWNHSGSGIPLLWPWPKGDVGSLLVLDYGVRHGSFGSIFSLANVRAVCYDLCLFGTITAGVLLWRAQYVLKKPTVSPPAENPRCLVQQEAGQQK
jgi:membrane-bound metal-dependent hydrolase YbcI (DUF457 family)